jgi:hypothetical protein
MKNPFQRRVEMYIKCIRYFSKYGSKNKYKMYEKYPESIVSRAWNDCFWLTNYLAETDENE